MGLVGSNDSADQSPNSLPTSAESYQVDELLAEFPDSDSAPVILVLSRADGGDLTAVDIEGAAAAQSRLLAVDRSVPDEPGPPPIVAPDGKAAIALVQVDSELSGFTLNELITELRSAAGDGLSPDLIAQVTGGPAFGADIANSFSGANFTLLAVTALVVAVLLIVTYRSPILWLVPLAVIGFADRFATTVGTALAQATGLSFDGSTSGITSVLVFGAGTNYALLLISRYREELRRESDHRLALHRAVRQAGPAILASNATVVLALLTLLLAMLPSTRSLGALAAAGLVVAAVFVLFVLPPLLKLCGPKLFWPFVPKESDRDTTTEGVWHSIAAGVARRPVATASITIVALLACCAALFGTQIGLSQTEQFRVTAESVEGFDTLSQHFPAGSADPMTVLAPTADIDAVISTAEGIDGVVSVDRVADSDTGLTRLSVVTDAAPASDESFAVVEDLRAALTGVDRALVGGSDAKALDTTDAAARDRLVVIPAILAVVLAVLLVLLRALVAPLILVATTVLSAVAAIGIGSWVSLHVFGFPALDDNTPLFAFLFLVALGVDYTIFLVTRTREETPQHGTRSAIVRAVSATGGVITSAGIVLAAVFCVLGVLPLITLTQLGIIVGLGILLDTFVVRTVVIPALFTLIGPGIWWPNRIDSNKNTSATQGANT
ncbi:MULTISPECIES: MMPL family transporter [Rhodococcus]|uniref:MMPL family transporter n=1 Tax=Rhodococcus cerastii TaxID=908616 RepID=A0ABU4CWN0_9NOCA|nr:MULTISPECIES: MMPL family transporter [Rhodococcus]MDV6301866.1 MMPL family transporter [Rhodococcus cerastii]MDV7988952.1 MMPL family transporter [Rhodococcus sp. IEGM 1374]